MIKPVSILLITGYLSLGILGMTIDRAITAPQPTEDHADTSPGNFPSLIQDVLEEASQRSGLPSSAFDKITAQRTTWRNGCLGVEEPGQICTQALVPGWRITLSTETQTWVYHTATDGRIRFAGQKNCSQIEQ